MATGHAIVLYVPNIVVQTIYAIGMRFCCLPETIRAVSVPELIVFVWCQLEVLVNVLCPVLFKWLELYIVPIIRDSSHASIHIGNMTSSGDKCICRTRPLGAHAI